MSPSFCLIKADYSFLFVILFIYCLNITFQNLNLYTHISERKNAKQNFRNSYKKQSVTLVLILYLKITNIKKKHIIL